MAKNVLYKPRQQMGLERKRRLHAFANLARLTRSDGFLKLMIKEKLDASLGNS
jgi:hypothetical protein